MTVPLNAPVPAPARTRPDRTVMATFDRHGTVLHAVATVLTRTPHRAEQLVLAAVMRPRTPWWRAGRPSAADSRAIVERLYRHWSRDDLPRSVVPRGTDPSIRQDLHQLTDSQLGALALCSVGGHTYRQAARVMGITPVRAALDLRAALTSLAAGTAPAAA